MYLYDTFKYNVISIKETLLYDNLYYIILPIKFYFIFDLCRNVFDREDYTILAFPFTPVKLNKKCNLLYSYFFTSVVKTSVLGIIRRFMYQEKMRPSGYLNKNHVLHV